MMGATIEAIGDPVRSDSTDFFNKEALSCNMLIII
jgi:hypothetical protein